MVHLARGNGTNVASQLSSSTSTSSLSMEDSSEQSGTPPEYEYDTLTRSSHLRQKFNIQPREDEGHEKLPPYSCAISLENVFMRKMELEGAVHRAHDRNWYRVYATLQGTALTFHKYKKRGMFEKSENSKIYSPDMPAGTKKGHFLRSYNLQHADVGIAADYTKKRHVIRVRAETDQFLLSCVNIETFVQWLQSLFAAIDLAPPLDDREIPRDLSIPRPRRRRHCIQLAGVVRNNVDVERNAQVIREQYEIIRQHYPGLVADPTMQEPGAGMSDSEIQETLSSLGEINLLPPSSTRHTPMRTSSVPNIPSAPGEPPLLELTRRSSAPVPNSRPSIDEETGKWRPEHQWSATFDLVYAKRCMAVLTSRSPRKSNYIILKGKQWIVDWQTGALTRIEPPEYGEIEGSHDGEIGGELRIGQYGGLVRV